MNKLVIALLVVLVIIGGILVWQNYKAKPVVTPPDNSQATIPDGWKTSADSQAGFSFAYPDKLPTTYITAQSWPPVVKLTQGTTACANESRDIHGWPYCVKTETEGAAGSIYTTYDYSTANPDSGQTIDVGFTLKSVQCGNYPDPEKTACEEEQQSFNLDNLVDQIVSTVKTTA